MSERPTQDIPHAETHLAPTGVPGLDDVLRGGLPAGHFYLVQGDPGVGKTTLGLQFLLECARAGDRCLYVSMSETRTELITVARSHGWSLDGIAVCDLTTLEEQLTEGRGAAAGTSTLFHPSDVELNQTIQVITDEVNRVRPTRVVLDSLSELRMLAESPVRYRRQVLALKQFFGRLGATVLLIENRNDQQSDLHVQSIAHGVISLERVANDYGAERRRLRVVKLRSVNYRTGYHDYLIEQGGLSVFPRLVAAEHVQEFEPGRASSDIAELDDLLGGGLARGSSTLFIGAAGTNKTTLACQFVAAACARGERACYYTFEETRAALIGRAATLGIDLRCHVNSGCLTVHQIDPAELTPGEMSARIRDAVESGTRMIALDSLNGYLNSMPEERFLVIHLRELLTYLSHNGVVTLMVLAQHGMLHDMESPADVTYLADTVVATRYFEAAGEVKKAISVIKKRGGRHENTIREIKVAQRGLSFGPPLRQFQGVLTGVPSFNNHDPTEAGTGHVQRAT